MGVFSSLNHEQREATAILQIGTFLEYFDLMLYVHMATVLNNLFFPKTDPHIANLLSATAFCTTFVFRPFGALIFGYIGDTVGRKATVVITTILSAFSCAAMAILPTYEQIGITAAWLFILCRISQGICSMGEIMGAIIYLTELIKVPERYPVVTFIGCADFLGTLAALAVATAVLSAGMEWRLVFWCGAIIAVVGTVARTALRETPEFVNAKYRLKKQLEQASIDPSVVLDKNLIVNEKVNQKTSLAYFLIQCSRPVSFYFLYVYCASILTKSFNYSPQQVIQHNLMITAVEFLVILVNAYLSYKIYPLKIVNIRLLISGIFIVFLPLLLNNITTVTHLLLIQVFMCLFKPAAAPAAAIFFVHFPVFKRFTYASFLYALSRALMYVVTSFGVVYLTKMFNHWGLLIIFIPMFIGFKLGVSHFEKLEREAGNDPHNIALNLAPTNAAL